MVVRQSQTADTEKGTKPSSYEIIPNLCNKAVAMWF